MKAVIAISLIFFIVSPLSAGEMTSFEQTTKEIMPNILKPKFRNSDVQFNLGVKSGVSSNPVQLPSEDKVKANFYELKPEIFFERELAENLFLISNLKGEYKDFDDKIVSNVKSSFKAQLDLGFSYFINSRHEVGVTGSGTYNKSSGLNFTSTGLDTFGRSIEYNQFFYELYYSYDQPKYYIEFSASQIANKNQSLVQNDIAGINGTFSEFKDDFKQTNLKIKANYKLSEDLTVFIEPTYSRRSYNERAARFTEGATDQAANPKLVELHSGASFGVIFDDGFVKSEIKGLLVKEDDLIYKASSAKNYGLETKILLPIMGLFELGAEYSWSKRNFDFFVVNPQEDPTSNNLRKDITQAWGLALLKQISKINMEIKYNSINKDSNYRPFGSKLGSKYNEQIISLGFNLKL